MAPAGGVTQVKLGIIRLASAADDQFGQTAQPVAPLLAVDTHRVTLTGFQLRRASHPGADGDCPVNVNVGINTVSIAGFVRSSIGLISVLAVIRLISWIVASIFVLNLVRVST